MKKYLIVIEETSTGYSDYSPDLDGCVANGKGSTSAILASILEEAGYRTGLYTSPHLVRVNERIRVNGREISDEDFARSFAEVRQTVDRLLGEKSLAHRPSFFEYLTATAF